MSSFTTQLKVSPLDNGTDWVVLEDFRFYVGSLDSNTYVDIPVGFVTDFASVPRILWTILPPWGKYGKAAVIHDWLFSKNTMFVNGVEQELSDRTLVEDIFLEAMGVLDVNVCVRYPMFWATKVYRMAVDKIKKLKK